MALDERFPSQSVAQALEARVLEDGDRVFLIYGNRRFTYAQVEARAAALAAALQELGVEPGDRIVLTLPNWPEFIISIFAAAKLGAVVVPLNPGYTVQELRYMLRHSEAAVVFCAERFGDMDYLDLFEGFFNSLPDLQYVVTVGDEELWYDDRIYQFRDLLSSGQGRPTPTHQVDPEEDVFALLYTSGTTGKPKSVALTHWSLLRTAGLTVEAIDLGPEDIVFGVTTVFNVFGLGPGILGSMLAGAGVILQERFEPAEALDLIQRHRATIHYGVPTVFVTELRELQRSPRDLSSLRAGIVAGAPAGDDLLRRIRGELCPGVQSAYSLTETASTVSITRSDDPAPKQVFTVGRPLPGTELRVLDAQDRSLLPVESIGEIAVRGAGLMKCYHRQPGATAQAFNSDGFFLTGDLGMVDDEGYLHIIGRRKELIIRGGFSIYPREVEDRLHAHPAVDDVAVVGLAHDVLGEAVCACIVPVEGAIITGEEIRDWCRGALAEYKVPDLVSFFDSFPLTGSGDVRRIELARAISAEGLSSRA